MPRIRTLARNAGFSIIELMIAIVLGALVVAGLVNVLIANRQAYHLQEANNYNQQNMRFAMDRIGWSLRMADFFGGAPAVDITGAPVIPAGAGNCNAAWALAVTQPVYGYDGSAGMPADLAGCINAANYVNGADILILRYADTDALEAAAVPIPGKVYLQVQTGGHGVLFVTTPPASPAVGTPGVSTYPYAVEMFYLRPCSDPGAGGICSAGSDGGNPIPTLMRLRLDDTGTLINEPVVEGIEQLQFEYGVRDPLNP
ncbi:MAG: prepilin-type N-terminal cleavage/methylation domain-containing protein, partial [Pseudomonadota bacterium]|nr:prepilin-type N-terminal cleavage/methylation domain-containing protein [Pseudomonadota bacterium]